MVIHRSFVYKYVKKTFEILRSEITFLMDLYSQGMQAYQQWDEMIKYFASASKRGKVTYQVAKNFFLSLR